LRVNRVHGYCLENCPVAVDSILCYGKHSYIFFIGGEECMIAIPKVASTHASFRGAEGDEESHAPAGERFLATLGMT